MLLLAPCALTDKKMHKPKEYMFTRVLICVSTDYKCTIFRSVLTLGRIEELQKTCRR